MFTIQIQNMVTICSTMVRAWPYKLTKDTQPVLRKNFTQLYYKMLQQTHFKSKVVALKGVPSLSQAV